MAKINEQQVPDEVVRIATEEEGVDTAVVSFFDVNYVRSSEGGAGQPNLERASERRQQTHPFLRR